MTLRTQLATHASEPAHERELDDVPGPDGAHAARLKAVVQRETGGGRADADQQDVLAGVPEGNLRGLGSRGGRREARGSVAARWIDRSIARARNVRVASRGERPRRARAFRRASAGAWDRSRAHLLLVVGGGGGHDARAAAGRGASPRAARRCGAPGRASRTRQPYPLAPRARRARRGRAGGDARAGGGDGGERGGDAGGHEAFGARRTRGTGVGGGAREGAKTALGDDVAMTRCRGAGRVRWPDASRALTMAHRIARTDRLSLNDASGRLLRRRWRSNVVILRARSTLARSHRPSRPRAEMDDADDADGASAAPRGAVRLARAPTRLPVDPTPTRARRATLFLVR